MQEIKEKLPAPPDGIGFIIYRCIVALIIIVTLTGIKFLLPKTFKGVKKYYKSTFAVDVNAEYFLSGLNDKD